MKRLIIAAILSAASLPAMGQQAMPRQEREAYLEACLTILNAPILAGTQRLGTGDVTRGHATVALFDPQHGRSMTLDCTFSPLTEGGFPAAQSIRLLYSDGTSTPIDAAEADELIAAGMTPQR